MAPYWLFMTLFVTGFVPGCAYLATSLTGWAPVDPGALWTYNGLTAACTRDAFITRLYVFASNSNYLPNMCFTCGLGSVYVGLGTQSGGVEYSTYVNNQPFNGFTNMTCLTGNIPDDLLYFNAFDLMPTGVTTINMYTMIYNSMYAIDDVRVVSLQSDSGWWAGQTGGSYQYNSITCPVGQYLYGFNTGGEYKHTPPWSPSYLMALQGKCASVPISNCTPCDKGMGLVYCNPSYVSTCRPLSSSQPITSSQPVTSSQQPLTSSRPITSSQRPLSSSIQQPVTSSQPALTRSTPPLPLTSPQPHWQ